MATGHSTSITSQQQGMFITCGHPDVGCSLQLGKVAALIRIRSRSNSLTIISEKDSMLQCSRPAETWMSHFLIQMWNARLVEAIKSTSNDTAITSEKHRKREYMMSPHAKEECWTAPPHCLRKPRPSHHFGEALCASRLQTPPCMSFLLPRAEYCIVHLYFFRMQQLDHHFGEAPCG